MAVILGVDPGLSGAWALYDLETGVILAGDLPKTGEKARQTIEGGLFATLIESFKIEAAAVELVGAMPGQGVSSMFRFGAATGEVLGVIKALRIPLYRPTPAVWKRHFGLIGKEKEDSRQLVIQRFPQAASLVARKMDDGRAEAILIALHHAETVAPRGMVA